MPDDVNPKRDILDDLDFVREQLGTDIECGKRQGQRWIRPQPLAAQIREIDSLAGGCIGGHGDGPWPIEIITATKDLLHLKEELLERMWDAHADLCAWALHWWDGGAPVPLGEFLLKMELDLAW